LILPLLAEAEIGGPYGLHAEIRRRGGQGIYTRGRAGRQGDRRSMRV
jgi:hypothetical protein